MDAGRFPEIAHLLGAYFHQDWMLDDPSADDVIRRYVRGEGERVEALGTELRSLLATEGTEADLEQQLGPFTFFDPRSQAPTIREWLDHVRGVLAEPVS